MLANSKLAYYVPCTKDVGRRPPNSSSMLGQRCSPLTVNRLRRWPNSKPSQCLICILYANTGHSTNALSMLTHSLRRRPVIETALGDCNVFSDSCIKQVTLYILAPETPENTMHWPNADVMLCHRLRRWANIITTKTL